MDLRTKLEDYKQLINSQIFSIFYSYSFGYEYKRMFRPNNQVVVFAFESRSYITLCDMSLTVDGITTIEEQIYY